MTSTRGPGEGTSMFMPPGHRILEVFGSTVEV